MFEDNSVDYCKFGLTVSNTGANIGAVWALNNYMRYNYISAFRVQGNGRLKGSNNRMRDSGCYSGSSGAKGNLIIMGSGALVDFGQGYNGQGASFCVSGICMASNGSNYFCRTPPEPTNSQCSGIIRDVDNSAGAKVSARSNCWGDFSNLPCVSGTVLTNPAYQCSVDGFPECQF